MDVMLRFPPSDPWKGLYKFHWELKLLLLPGNPLCGEGNGTLLQHSCLENRTLAWKIPWTEEPGGLQSMGSLRVGHD